MPLLVLGGSTGKASGMPRTQSGVDGPNILRGLDREGRLDLCSVSLHFDVAA